MATDPDQPLLTAEEFLQIDFGPDIKAELDNGVIRMMGGGSGEHARVQANFMRFLGSALRGTGCRPFGSDMGVRTHDQSIRYPDVSVYCSGRTDPANDALKAFDDPRVVIEVLSPSTRRKDYGDKLEEYREMPSIDTIVFADPSTERLRIVQRTSPNSWSDESFVGPVDLPLPSLNLTMPHAEIFARD